MYSQDKPNFKGWKKIRFQYDIHKSKEQYCEAWHLSLSKVLNQLA